MPDGMPDGPDKGRIQLLPGYFVHDKRHIANSVNPPTMDYDEVLRVFQEEAVVAPHNKLTCITSIILWLNVVLL